MGRYLPHFKSSSAFCSTELNKHYFILYFETRFCESLNKRGSNNHSIPVLPVHINYPVRIFVVYQGNVFFSFLMSSSSLGQEQEIGKRVWTVQAMLSLEMSRDKRRKWSGDFVSQQRIWWAATRSVSLPWVTRARNSEWCLQCQVWVRSQQTTNVGKLTTPRDHERLPQYSRGHPGREGVGQGPFEVEVSYYYCWELKLAEAISMWVVTQWMFKIPAIFE